MVNNSPVWFYIKLCFLCYLLCFLPPLLPYLCTYSVNIIFGGAGICSPQLCKIRVTYKEPPTPFDLPNENGLKRRQTQGACNMMSKYRYTLDEQKGQSTRHLVGSQLHNSCSRKFLGQAQKM